MFNYVSSIILSERGFFFNVSLRKPFFYLTSQQLCDKTRLETVLCIFFNTIIRRCCFFFFFWSVVLTGSAFRTLQSNINRGTQRDESLSGESCWQIS